MSAPNHLTRKQQETLAAIYELYSQYERPPTLDEIAQKIGIHSRSTTHQHVQTLIKEGHLLKGSGKRAYELPNESFSGQLELLGRIAAGLPIQAIPEQTTINPNQELVRSGRFALQVRGESMMDIGVLDGDYVVIQSQPCANNGEVVAALIDGYETTLKRFYNLGDGRVELRPENRTMSPLIYPAQSVEIQGRMVGVFRKWD